MAIPKPKIAEYVVIPNVNGYSQPRGKIEAVVMHIAEGYRAGVTSWFRNPQSNASAHFLVCRDGSIVQYGSAESAAAQDSEVRDSTWANGLVLKPDMSNPIIRSWVERKVNPNLHTVSIEHEGWSGQPLTEPQIASSVALAAYLCDRFEIDPDVGLLGHFQIDSVNKSRCPGPAFPWARIRDEVRRMLERDPSAWAEEAWAWAVEQGITDGTNPRAACTREQVVVMLHRALGLAKKSKTTRG